MIEFSADREFIRPWIICEANDRWLRAVRRFGPEIMPPPLIPAIRPAEPMATREMLSGVGPALILWEVGDSLASICDCLARTAIDAPQVLQLVAGSQLSDRETIMLSEFRCGAVIRQVEDLPRLARMIHGYFAMSTEYID
jgi:hypothetical protein